MPIINYTTFSNVYFTTIVNASLKPLLFEAYKEMVASTPLSTMFSGRSYYTVRDALSSIHLITRSSNYIPLLLPVHAPRLFPMGEYVEFDIYTKKPYERRNKRYTVQIRFNIWLPFGALITTNVPQRLYSLFFPIANLLFSRINVGASLDDMLETQNIPATIGIKSRTNAMVHNVNTVSIIITKIESSTVNSYIYDYILRYQWRFDDMGGNAYNIEICNLQILHAQSCRSNKSLYDLYNDTYREFFHTDKNRYDYFTIFDKCPFTWKLYTPPRTPLCRTVVDTILYL
ncbi:hypothetical protein [Deltalipothrixvirus pozzuoliense]|uniref:Uncharacterized protein ORF286b n=1 Tax=Acidianus filamentous virus 2 (isolate Italy/Pozzuoli) TaxID=654910 RepID=Y286B_AFV2P|nr:hypothetical protein AFV2_gp51 [Acidianus filamentous virus 2]Q573B8.1 RecName: Full=Uncharacterized protein ORF286b [Acidianus filamentous virus 2 (isolate Pozzuoli)]CAH69438.1 hypothetical protein [Acidianus filamentous virus 2]